MKHDLETRIADAFASKMTSAQLTSLLSEVDRADRDAQEAKSKASDIALDPATRPEAVTSARKAMEDATFNSQRMAAATARLTGLKAEALEIERSDAAVKEYQAAELERDKLVPDLQEYAELAAKITALVERIAASNHRLNVVNASRAGAYLYPAEKIARGVTDDSWVVRPDSSLPKLVEAVMLPRFTRSAVTNHGYLWPKP